MSDTETDVARLCRALRSLADALEGNGPKPLPCSDGNIPAGRLLSMLGTMRDHGASLREIAGEAEAFSDLMEDLLLGQDAVETLADYGLLDE